ncbi:hypothetical protein ACA910_004429 [Epithemia clementina (nom. ined.)]
MTTPSWLPTPTPEPNRTKLHLQKIHVNRDALEANVTADALSPQNIELINRLYKMDFVAFGFQMRQPD